jgi:hypothetical protein
MNINLIRLKSIVTELRGIRLELARLAGLKELELERLHGISRQPADVQDTQVNYTDPEYAEMVAAIERRAGRRLSDQEAAAISAILDELD